MRLSDLVRVEPGRGDEIVRPPAQPFAHPFDGPAVIEQEPEELFSPQLAAKVSLVLQSADIRPLAAYPIGQEALAHPRALRKTLETRFLGERRQAIGREMIGRHLGVRFAVNMGGLAHMSDGEKGVGHVDEQAVVRQQLPRAVQSKKRRSAELRITHCGCRSKGTATVETRHRITPFAEQHRGRQLVVREGQRETHAGIAGLMQQPFQRGAAIGADPGWDIEVGDAHHRTPEMIFGRPCEVLEAKLVLDRDQQDTIRLEQCTRAFEPVQRGILPCRKAMRVLQYAYQRDDIEACLTLEMLQIIHDHPHAGKVFTTFGRCPRAPVRRLQCNHRRGRFTEIAGDCTAPRTDLKH